MVVSVIQKVLDREFNGTQMLPCLFAAEWSGKKKLKVTVKVLNSYSEK